MDGDDTRVQRLLAPLTNYERQRPDRVRWSLDNMRDLLSRPGASQLRGRLVQVGGSKGKGTTSLYIESLARGAGLRVGTYLSPHLESLLERVRLEGASITEPMLSEALEPILEFAMASGKELSFFEAMTAAAVESFAAAGVDMGVLEVGLGGRLDATTAVPVDASILTNVELEHTELLGDSVAAIAAEKAHVLRPGRPGFTAASGDSLDVFRQHAREIGAELLVLGEDFEVEVEEETEDAFWGRLVIPGGAPRSFQLEGAARFELPAFGLAMACLSRLYPDLEFPLQPVPRPALPGRCEVVICPDGNPIILDGAHTEGSMHSLAIELERKFPGQRTSILFATASGKRWQEGLNCLLEKADRVLVTDLSGTVAESPEMVREWIVSRGVSAELVTDVREGLRVLADHPGPRVVTGSFYLVGEVREAIR